MSRVLLSYICSDIVDCVNKTAPTVDFETPYKMLRTSNVRDGQIFIDDLKCVTREVYEKWNRRIVPQAGDIILTREAPLGEVGMLRDWENLFLGQRLMLYRIDGGKANNKYVLYSFQCHDIQSQISALASGSTVQHMRVPDAEKITITLPSRLQQDRIAAVLSSYEELIYINNRRISILEEMAQRLYREWFVHFRFPGHENVEMVSSELGIIPEGWEARPFTEAVKVNPKYPKPNAESYPYVEMAGLNNSNMLVSLSNNRNEYKGSKFSNGDTLVARITPCLENGKTGYVQCLGKNEIGIGSTEFIVLQAKAISSEMVYLAARQDDFRGLLIKSMSGASGRQRANITALNDYYIAVPTTSVIKSFSQIVRPMFEQINRLDKKNGYLRKTRDLLLPRLISGDIDVSNIGIPV